MTVKKIALTASQAQFVALESPFSLFCGGYGSGKSYTMGFCSVMDAHHSANAVISLYEPDYSLIKTVAYPNVEHFLNEFGIRYKLNQQDHAIYTSNPGVGDFVFKSMDNPETLVGYESYSSHLDELDTLTEEKARRAWQKIMGRNRQNPKGVDERYKKWSDQNKRFECVNRIRAYTTPEGFKFCYKMWGQNKNPDFQMVKGKTEDNPTLSEAYLRQLRESYPSNLIEAYLNGEFVNLTSGSVYHCYDRKLHNSLEEIHHGETLYIGCDFNVGKTSATVYVRRNGGQDWHAVDEMTGMLDTPEMIRVIQARYQSKGHSIIMYPDSTGAGRHNTNANTSSIAMLAAAGFQIRAKAKNPLVVDRINATNKMFSDNRLFVNSIKCPEVARCFEQQAYNKNGEPDKESGTDHQNDASTYPIAFECAIRKPLFKVDYSFMQKSLY